MLDRKLPPPVKDALRPLYQRVMSRLPAHAHVAIDYFRAHGRLPKLRPPETFNEKVTWRKLYDRDDRLPALVDKVRSKDIIAAQYGPQFIIPTLAVYENAAEIDFDRLEPPYVVKPNHSSGMNLFVLDHNFDPTAIRRKAARFLRTDFAASTEDWAYSCVRRKLLVERYMTAAEGYLIDYKFHVFGGRVSAVEVVHDRHHNYGAYFCDRDYKLLNVHLRGCPIYPGEVKRPKTFPEMLVLAESIGRDFSYVRVDVYEIEGQVKFGELTFYPGSGYDGFDPPEWDLIFGKQWDLNFQPANQDD